MYEVDEKGIRELLDGSDIIDQMEREIGQMIGMIVGLLSPHDIQRWTLASRTERDRVCEHHEGADATWEVTEHSANPVRLRFRCFRKFRTTSRPGEIVYQIDPAPHGTPTMRYDDVRFVRASLPLLVSGLQKMFPTLEERLQPFRDAAKASR